MSTRFKPPVFNFDESSDISSFNTTSSSFVDVTGSSIASFTTQGGRLFFGMKNTGSNQGRIGSGAASGSPESNFTLAIVRDSTIIAELQYNNQHPALAGGEFAGHTLPSSVISHNSVETAGTFTFKLQLKRGGNATDAFISDSNFFVYEMPHSQ